MPAAGNVDEALALLAQYCRIDNKSVQLRLTKQADGMLVEASFSEVSRHRIRQTPSSNSGLSSRAYAR